MRVETLETSLFLTLTSWCVSFLDPQSAARPTTSLSLPQLVRDLPTLANTTLCFPYLGQTLREKVTSFTSAHVHHPSLHVAPLPCTSRLPYAVIPLSCLWSCKTTKNIFFKKKFLIEPSNRSIYLWA